MFDDTDHNNVVAFIVSVLSLVWGSWNFHKWGLLLFIPFLAYVYHEVTVDELIKELEEAKKEDIDCMIPQLGDHGYDE